VCGWYQSDEKQSYTVPYLDTAAIANPSTITTKHPPGLGSPFRISRLASAS
jgi:hypothetical protein